MAVGAPFVDVDGYADVLERFEDGTSPRDFHDARVRFTRKYGVGDLVPLAAGPAVPGPGLVPFVDDDIPVGEANSLIPIPGVWDPAPNGRRWSAAHTVGGRHRPVLLRGGRPVELRRGVRRRAAPG